MSVYLCISIDCECDKGPGWRTRKPLAFSGILHGVRDHLQPLFRRFHVKPTYLLSPEIMRDTQAVETLAKLDGGVELGTHLHGEFAEPGAFEPEITSAFQCHYDRETERQKLHSLTNLFRNSFGLTPRSFRAGRFGIGRHSLELLQDLGYIVDSSVTPHVDWTGAGAPEASFRCAPTQPYWPVLDDAERVASEGGTLLEVPVTIRPSLLTKLPIVSHWSTPRWLRPTRGSVNGLVAVAKDEIRHARSSYAGRPIVLNCMFHNVEIIPGASPYAKNEAQAGAIMERLAGLLAFAEREDIRSLGLGDIPELFASSNHSNRSI
ncbi:MAG: hypothetical protein KGJ79_03250 [Alphaproteobacteria bacterium]|nr:hypothetical protein [Alphaproteobacteria bacterium]MDE2492622.1 hypothetical protein [Alphaproteobacteria bacterium]